MAMKWKVTRGNELSAQEIYTILELRTAVFVVEQNCPYQELDGRDLGSEIYHVQGFVDDDKDVAAVTRIMYDADAETVQIGRVVVNPKYRGLKLGRQLMQVTLDNIESLQPIYHRKQAMLHGQSHLKRFYESFGFVQVGEEFLEDDIPHLEMIKNLK